MRRSNFQSKEETLMKRVLGITLGLVVLFGSVQITAQEAPAAAGTWAVTIEAQQGARTFDVKLNVEGSKVTGIMQGPQGEIPLTGTVDGAKIQFSATLDFGGQQFVLGFSGIVDKDSMTGTVDFGGQGGGPFKAQRKK
jgi:hypothetical protein